MTPMIFLSTIVLTIGTIAALWISAACIHGAALRELLSEEIARATRGEMRLELLLATRDAERLGYAKGKGAAREEHTQFIRAQESQWIGPRVEQEFVRALVHPSPDVRFYKEPRRINTSLNGTVVNFRCNVHALKVHGCVFKFPVWERVP